MTTSAASTRKASADEPEEGKCDVGRGAPPGIPRPPAACGSAFEINASFGGLLTPDTYRRWYGDATESFLRHALETRDKSYQIPEVASTARKYGIALVVSDSGDWPRIAEVSSDFVYVRLLGRPRT